VYAGLFLGYTDKKTAISFRRLIDLYRTGHLSIKDPIIYTTIKAEQNIYVKSVVEMKKSELIRENENNLFMSFRNKRKSIIITRMIKIF
jgi:hypothetical protein